MGREDLSWIGLILVLLTIGLFLGQRLLESGPDTDRLTSSMDFRQWFWESRGLDLAAQVGLILTGALAIAALLPRAGDNENDRPNDSPPPDSAPQDKT
jgi:hypothetical protein